MPPDLGSQVRTCRDPLKRCHVNEEYKHIKSLDLKFLVSIYRLLLKELGAIPLNITSQGSSVKIQSQFYMP